MNDIHDTRTNLDLAYEYGCEKEYYEQQERVKNAPTCQANKDFQILDYIKKYGQKAWLDKVRREAKERYHNTK